MAPSREVGAEALEEGAVSLGLPAWEPGFEPSIFFGLLAEVLLGQSFEEYLSSAPPMIGEDEEVSVVPAPPAVQAALGAMHRNRCSPSLPS
jgi:hypothetical protein